MNQMYKSMLGRSFVYPLQYVSRQFYHFPQTKFPTASKNPVITAKRIMKVCGERLRKIDPQRWETTPITFMTNWNDEGGYTDVATCVHIHDALEKEFGIEIRDRGILCHSVSVAFYVVMLHHDSI